MAVHIPLVGCVQDVSLGSWDVTVVPSSTESPIETHDTVEPDPADAGAESSSPNIELEAGTPTTRDAGSGVLVTLPTCLQTAPAGEWSAAGAPFTATETSTDWNLPKPVQSLSWSLMIERDVTAGADDSRTNGYYWLQQFSFVPGLSGRFGLQTRGIYQSAPLEPTEVTKMAVFWLSGTPLAAELGDIPFPDARIAPVSAAGTVWLTIHARFEWEVCHVYQFHVQLESTEPDGSMWYAVSIDDTTIGEDTLLGRILLPQDTGMLSPFSVSRTVVIDFSAPACSTIQPGAAVFGAPTSDGEVAERSESRFAEPLACTSSRFALFPDAVRHELGGPF